MKIPNLILEKFISKRHGVLTFVFVISFPQLLFASVRTYFNYNHQTQYVDPYRKIQRTGDNLEEVILSQLKKANRTIDIAVQELRLPQVAILLKNKAASGVKVRIILENTYNHNVLEMKDIVQSQDGGSESSENSNETNRLEELKALVDFDQNGSITKTEMLQLDAVEILRNSKAVIIDDTSDRSRGSGLMHHKFLVVDGESVLVSTANLTLSCIHGDLLKSQTRGNANSLTVIESSQVAKLFVEEFNLMWSGQFGVNKLFRPVRHVRVGSSVISVKFSPTSGKQAYSDSTNGLIAKELKNVKKQLKAALFVFSEQNLANQLKENLNAPRVYVLVENKFAFRYFSEILDLMGYHLPNTRCGTEVDNNPWERPAELAAPVRLTHGDAMHHKFAVIDSEKVIVGSHNWSQSANRQNDETLIIIQDSKTAGQFTQEFHRMETFALKNVIPPISTQQCH